jgi:hypothetical protein
MIFRGNFSHFFGETMLPSLHHIIKEEWGKVTEQWSQRFRVETSDRDIEQTSSLFGLGLFRQIDEGDIITYDNPGQGYKKTFTHTRYGLGVKITQDTVEDNKFGLIERNVRALARSQKETLEIDIASTVNGGFATTLTPDGVYLFSASHPVPKTPGSVQSNLASGAQQLSVTSLELAMTAYETMVDDTGLQINLPMPDVVVAPKNRWNVTEILKSPMRSDTANNATNAFRQAGNGGLPGYMVWRYLTNADDWFLMAPPAQTELICFWRRKPYTKGSVDDDTEVAKTMRRYRKSHGAAHYLGTYGVKGT